jgi:uncharacterized protein (DUF3820 family)
LSTRRHKIWHNARPSPFLSLKTLVKRDWYECANVRVAAQQIIMNPEYLQLLVTREMPYGKYKGRLIADLPGHYLGWFAREGFPSGELGTLIALMYELDHNALRHLLDPLRKG